MAVISIAAGAGVMRCRGAVNLACRLGAADILNGAAPYAAE